MKCDPTQTINSAFLGFAAEYISQHYLDIESLWVLLLEFGIWSF
jgi:hypothetical protein